MKESLLASRKDMLEAAGTGICFTGFILAACFLPFQGNACGAVCSYCLASAGSDRGAGRPVLGEQVTWRQWLGIALGFGGAALVLGLDVGGELPL